MGAIRGTSDNAKTKLETRFPGRGNPHKGNKGVKGKTLTRWQNCRNELPVRSPASKAPHNLGPPDGWDQMAWFRKEIRAFFSATVESRAEGLGFRV